MEDNIKYASYQTDQEVLDARGINLSVEEVGGLSTVKYAEKVHGMGLSIEDLTFLKVLRRRIKNRMASHNSRRRNIEHLRRLARELRAVRTRRDAVVRERRALMRRRDQLRARCRTLRDHCATVLKERSDPTPVPSLNIEEDVPSPHTHNAQPKDPKESIKSDSETHEKNLFECSIETIVHDSVNRIYREKINNKIYAKTIFLTQETRCSTDVKSAVLDSSSDGVESAFGGSEVLNLSVKKRSHGRKQSAPRRITYAFNDDNDGVLDLKVKRENQ